MLTVAYGEATLGRSLSVVQNVFRGPRRCERRRTCRTPELVNHRRKHWWSEENILVKRRIIVREVAEDLNISIGSCHSIFTNDLGMRRVAAKFVPKLLNFDRICSQKQHTSNAAATVFPRSDPLWLFLVPKTEEAHESTTLHYDWGDKDGIEGGTEQDHKK